MKTGHLSRALLACALGLVLALGAMAAGQANVQQGRHGHHGQGMMKALNLTDAQRDQIKGIVQQSKAEAKRINDSNLSQDQKRSQLQALHQRTREQIRSILTPEQQAKFDQMRREHGMMRGCFKNLNLTPQQKQQAKAIRDTAKQRMGEVKANSTLTEAQKKEQITAIRRTARTDFEALLTPAQKQQLEKCRSEHKRS